MHMARLILVTVLVLCACICAAAQQSSYILNDADFAMQSSYGDKTGRRLQQGSGGGTVQNSTETTPGILLHDSETDRGSPANSSIPTFVTLVVLLTIFMWYVLTTVDDNTRKIVWCLLLCFLVYAFCVMDFSDGGRLQKLQSMIKDSDTDGDKARAWVGTIALALAVMCYTWSFRNRGNSVIVSGAFSKFGTAVVGLGRLASVTLIVMVATSSNSTVVDTAAWIAIVVVLLALCIILYVIEPQNQVLIKKIAIGIAVGVIFVCTILYSLYASGIWEFVMVVMIFFIAALLIAVGYDKGAVFQIETESASGSGKIQSFVLPASTGSQNWKRNAKFVLRL